MLGTTTIDARRRRRGRRALRHGRRRRSTTCARRPPRRSSARSSRCRRWCRRCKVGGQRLHELARAGDRGRARAAAASPCTASTSTPTRRPGRVRASTSSARRAPTSARWPPTSARALGGGAHLRNLRRTRDRLVQRRPTPRRSTRSTPTHVLLRRPTRCVTTRRCVVDADGRRRRSRTVAARCDASRVTDGAVGGARPRRRAARGVRRRPRPAVVARRPCSPGRSLAPMEVDHRSGARARAPTGARWSPSAPTTACTSATGR